jgi:hypothetical protein
MAAGRPSPAARPAVKPAPQTGFKVNAPGDTMKIKDVDFDFLGIFRP